MRREFIFALCGLLLGAGSLAVYLAPRLTAHSPNGVVESAVQPIVLTFSQPIDPASARSRFWLSPPVEGRLEAGDNQLVFTPDSPLSYNQSYTVTVAAGVRGENGLPLLRPASWQIRIGRPSLVFLRTVEGLVNLWSMKVDSNDMRQLSDEPLGVWDYSPSHNGQQILLSSLDEDGSDDLFLINHDGSGRRKLLACGDSECRSGRWQPGDQLIAYERRPLSDIFTPSQVWLLEPESGRTWAAHPIDLLSEAGMATYSSRFPRWSADGRFLSYFKTDANAIVVLDMRGGEPTLIPTNLNDMGEWSPSGAQLAYTELTLDHHPAGPGVSEAEPGAAASEDEPHLHENDALLSHLVLANLANERIMDVSQGLDADDGRPAWRPDGGLIAFPRARGGGGRQLWTIRPDGTEPEALTDQPDFNHSSLAWAPDGRLLAFMRLDMAAGNTVPGVWLYDRQNGVMRMAVEGGFLPGWLP